VSIKLFTREELLPLARSHPEVLVDIILALQERLVQLEQRVQELEAQLARNSSNSGKPPSSDGLSKPSPKSLREPSGRKPGGQPGHPGHTLQRVKTPDHIEVHRLENCPQCGGRGLGRKPVLDYESRQVFDLPELSLAVTEHRAEIKGCPHCGQRVGADFPTGVSAPAQYGPRFQSLMVYLNQQQLLPYDRLAQLCEDLFGQPLSVATLAVANERAYHQLDPFAQAMACQVPQAPVVHLDESGLRVAGKLHWLHVASTATLTCYGVHPKRGAEAMDALGVVGACRQWVVHDHWKPYFSYQQCQHALCNEHLLRELKFLWEEDGQVWAREMSDLLLSFHRRRQKRGEFNERQFKRALQRYRNVVRRGRYRHPRLDHGQGRSAQSKAANLLDRLEDFDWNILAFLWDGRVPFTNNQAEQDIRMIKVRQKISGCFRTLRGAQIFCRIRSFLSTCRKQGRNLWLALQSAVNGAPFIPSAPHAGP
jgi:transposase-like protein